MMRTGISWILIIEARRFSFGRYSAAAQFTKNSWQKEPLEVRFATKKSDRDKMRAKRLQLCWATTLPQREEARRLRDAAHAELYYSIVSSLPSADELGDSMNSTVVWKGSLFYYFVDVRTWCTHTHVCMTVCIRVWSCRSMTPSLL